KAPSLADTAPNRSPGSTYCSSGNPPGWLVVVWMRSVHRRAPVVSKKKKSASLLHHSHCSVDTASSTASSSGRGAPPPPLVDGGEPNRLPESRKSTGNPLA
ncbi:unnamed protein product, partial [Laminaria digitata]